MHKIKTLILFAAVISVGILTSCGGDDNGDDPKSAKELTVEALAGTWNLDAANSQFGNGLNDGAITSVTISATGFTLVGDITTYIGGGSFTVSDAGALENAAVAIASSDLELDGSVSVALDAAKTTLTVTFATKEKGARVDGLGSYKLVFVKAS